MSTSYKFVNRPLESGLYEPEGIYLSSPFAGRATLLQGWGQIVVSIASIAITASHCKGIQALTLACLAARCCWPSTAGGSQRSVTSRAVLAPT